MIMDYGVNISMYFQKLKDTIDKISIDELNTLMNVMEQAKDEGRTIFIMGNGGSSATASHYVCDFNKGVSFGKKEKYKLVCLNDNVPSLMAYANDLSFDDVFVYQLSSLFKEGDLVIGISGSGNSRNILKAIDFANNSGGITIGLTGYDGGKLKKMALYNVNIPVDDMQISEDLHMVIDHCMMQILCNK